MQANDLYHKVTSQIIAELEKGAVPWVCPWKTGNGGGIMPLNYATRRSYSGINILILWATREERGYATAEWLTFKQSCESGGRVRKGEKGTHVVFAKPHTFNEGQDDERKMFMHRLFTVFNIAQIEGLPESIQTPDFVCPPEGHVHKLIAATGADIRIGGDRACYVPSKDFIALPPFDSFKSEEHYFATSLHELVHWCGHETRLNRDLKNRFGPQAYAAEELVAELGGAFLCAHLGVQGELRHAGYIQNWLQLLREDDRAIFTAASRASQAADFLRSFSELRQ